MAMGRRRRVDDDASSLPATCSEVGIPVQACISVTPARTIASATSMAITCATYRVAHLLRISTVAWPIPCAATALTSPTTASLVMPTATARAAARATTRTMDIVQVQPRTAGGGMCNGKDYDDGEGDNHGAPARSTCRATSAAATTAAAQTTATTPTTRTAR